ncbi:methylmalonic aciduria type A, partial [Acrasis kona]
MVVLLLPPAGGDELQGIKRGIMEVADLIVINKADGSMVQAAKKAQRQVEAALHLSAMRNSSWQPQVMCCTSLTQVPIQLQSASHKRHHDIPRVPQVLSRIEQYVETCTKSGERTTKRSQQNKDWMWKQVNQELVTRLFFDQHVKNVISELQPSVSKGECSPRVAAGTILDTFVKHYQDT